jgi:ABC-type uncharacterized transport system substrate-binding protein
MPTVCDWPHPAGLRRRTADFAARTLRGTLVGKIPSEPPTTTELVINLKPARALGIYLPFWLLVQTNNVIELPTQ